MHRGSWKNRHMYQIGFGPHLNIRGLYSNFLLFIKKYKHMRQKCQWCVKTSQPQQNTSFSRKIFLFTYTSAQERMMACNKRIWEDDTGHQTFCLDIIYFRWDVSQKTCHSPAGFGDIRIRGSSAVTSLEIDLKNAFKIMQIYIKFLKSMYKLENMITNRWRLIVTLL